MVQGSDRPQPIRERWLRRWAIEAAAQPLEVELRLLPVAQVPEEGAQPWAAGGADLLAKDHHDGETEEQFVCCQVLYQALLPLSAAVPRLRQEEAGLQDGVELEEVAKEHDHGDPPERAMRVISVQPQAALYRRERETAHLADLVDDQHGHVLPTQLFFFRYHPLHLVLALESYVRRRVERHSADERGSVSAGVRQEQRAETVF